MGTTRREFLAQTLMAAGAVLAAPPLMHRIAEAAELAQSGPGAPLLVVVQLLGGNDGLNTVIPIDNPDYRKTRTKLAVEAKDALMLEKGMALHPSLKPLFAIWSEGHLAVVENVGYPNPVRSHFESMDIWNTANVTRPLGDGWLGKLVEKSLQGGSNTLAAVGIGGTLSPMLRSSGQAITCLDSLRFFQLVSPAPGAGTSREEEETIRSLYAHARVGAYDHLMLQTVEAAFQTSRTLQRIAEGYKTEIRYPQGRLGNSLKLAAQILAGNLGTRVVHVSLGGFDTHANQKPQQARLLQELAEGLSAFYQDLKAHGLGDRVLIMTTSEFGRRVAENASSGTDHGAASSHFVLGNRVKGGLYGGLPNLEDLDHGDLRFQVDFRSLYTTVLRDFLGVNPVEVLEQPFPTLPLVTGAQAKQTKLPGAQEPADRRDLFTGLAAFALRKISLPFLDLDEV